MSLVDGPSAEAEYKRILPPNVTEKMCKKCGVLLSKKLSKYCGDGSDKDNPHEWVPYDEVIWLNTRVKIAEATTIEKMKDVVAAVFVNGTDLKFADISSERYRVYEFPSRDVRIENPLFLNVSKNGHRVFDAQGVSHYIPQGWVHLYWEVRPGQPNFVK